ncbi:MAG: ATP-binding cassette domain-containing protein, partial [Buchnera aphidicola]|nr:ATP-binding cassette domain-containing protein [Buchnera aphidicola]MDE5286022.1 ATP-binding cassette domain-containing protein [Buchnera aphidicola]
FGNLKILNQAKLNIYNNEKICLTGKNGAGKSTLLKIINKKQDLDTGNIIYRKNIIIDYLEQENPVNLNISIYDFISNNINKKISPKNS